MPTIYSNIQAFSLLGSLLILLLFLTACSHHRNTRLPSPESEQATKSKAHNNVEQQLLATIQHAESLEPGNPLLLSSLYSLADFYHDRKEYDKAADQYQRALTIKEAINGPEHSDIAAILQRYARLLQEAKRPTEAANLLARADAILAHSSHHPPHP
ncbi:MAG: tetratricopeptide repeat protein [Nitrospirota bacterium]|nr:tetratricopeptide repeat protein [Nitrospirota bacterium]